MKRLAAMLLAAVMLPCMQTAQAAADAPALSAASAILVDGDTGRVLFEKNPHDKRLIASITKLMTALVAVEAVPDLEQSVEIRREWTLAEGSSMYLKPGEVLTLETLLYGLLLSSGNDAALAIAGFCGGDVEIFVGWMNSRAESLGMENTHFVNPNGLNHDEHYSTAYDMALLARECLKHPVLQEIMATKTATREGHTFANHNKLLWRYDGCIGMKTGYTERAGRTLVSAARRDGQTLICVTLADPDDWADHTALLDYGFDHYPRQILARAGKRFRSVNVKGSLVSRVAVETSHDVYYPVQTGERVEVVVCLPEQVDAPVKEGTIAGSLSFRIGDREIGQTYLLYSASVRRDLPRPWMPFGRAIAFLRGETVRADFRYSIYAA